jgi:hypothetical protein
MFCEDKGKAMGSVDKVKVVALNFYGFDFIEPYSADN